MRALFRTLLAILRELADENAYARHLRVHKCAHSSKQYRQFQDERFRSKYQKAKCC